MKFWLVTKTVNLKNSKQLKKAMNQQLNGLKNWYFGFLLEMIIDSDGKISYVNIGKEGEVKQLENLLEDLQDKWVLCDRGTRNVKKWQEFLEKKQIKVKITGGKERQWIENVFGFLKTKLGLDKIRVRSMSSFLSGVYAILCCYNIVLELDLAIWQFELFNLTHFNILIFLMFV